MEHPSLEDLKAISAFADLDTPQLEWLAAHFSNERYGPGEILVEAGTAADYMVAIFEGELQARRSEMGQEGAIYMAGAGRVTGKLPFSRMREFPSTVRAVGMTRIGRLREEKFGEMLAVIPTMGERLVGVLSDRIRETAKVDQNREKLAALGKMSAGLAHELNNPASAAQRAASNLREALKKLADSNRRMAACPMTDEQRVHLAELEDELAGAMDGKPVLDSLALSDREGELTQWLEKRGFRKGWEIAPALADSGFDTGCLDHIAGVVGDGVLGSALERVAATFNVERLVREIENSTKRMTVLVKAVKEYSYMDRIQEQEIDIHRGLDTTLAVLGHCMKDGVRVTREYDTTLPKLVANGGELNQVWTNLIDNAISAMKGKGELKIRTARENDLALVEIIDNGPGIPAAIQGRIFEPFFTTKGVGEGTGLGLDFAYRIVGRHHGEIRFTSRPGETRFQIRLPLNQPNGRQTDEAVHASESSS